MQVTSDTGRTSTVACQYIMRWTPDSKRFFFHRAASDDGSSKAGIWMCDVADGFAISPVYEWDTTLVSHKPYDNTTTGKIAETFVVNRDGRSLGVIVRNRDVIELCRVDVESRKVETVMTAPAPLSTGWMIDNSADGMRVAFHIFLGDGRTEGAPWGVRIFDLQRGTTWVVELDNLTHKGVMYRHGSTFCDSSEHAGMYDLVGHASGSPRLADGSWRTPADGSWRHPMPPADTSGGHGYTIVFKDDGSDYPRRSDDPCRVIPLPRPPAYQTSHAGWRGAATQSWVASMYNTTPQRWRAPFVEAWPTSITGAERTADANPADGKWTDLTRFVARADACHFDFDASGRHFVSDTDGYVLPQTCMLYIGTYIEPTCGDDPYFKTKLLGIPRTSWKGQPAHPHPFLSPDGNYAVFQSDFTGRPQINVAYGYGFPG